MNPNGLWSRPRLDAAAAAADFANGRASELRAANHQRVVPQPAGLQILDHGCEGLVRILGVHLVRHDVAMRIPWIALGVIDLRHPNALFDQPTAVRQPRATARAVQLQRGLGFLADVEHFRRLGLHAVGDFHGLDHRLDLRIGPVASMRIFSIF